MAFFEPVFRHFQSLALRLLKGTTLGARGLVTRNGEVFLVRHTYVKGWYLPGGAVDPGETVESSVRREVMEEGLIEVTGPVRLIGLFFNRAMAKRDHVAVYHIAHFVQTALPKPNREIAEVGWFPMDRLPQPMNPGSEARIREFLSGQDIDLEW